MNQTIQQTTQKLMDLLPEDRQYYRLDELHSWGLPPFIVQRIQVELERNLAESMILPKTDWANTQSEAVLHAWQQFVQAIRAEARLPASYAKAVIETAVADTLDMLIEPRKNIPDVIFGSDDKLDYDQLCNRVKAVVVYRHFATLVPRYMQKKDLDTLSRDRCDQLIRRADERLTANYSPLNWAQTLDPLFKLLDGQIDPSMLRLFFEDKEREKMAEVFDQKDESLNRAEFIEVLSSPDWVETQTTPGETGGKTTSEEESLGPERRFYEASGPEERKPAKDVEPEQKGEQETEQSDAGPAGEPEEFPIEEQPAEEMFAKRRKESDEEEDSKDSGFADLSVSEQSQNGGDDHSLNAAFGWQEESPSFDDEDETEEEESIEEIDREEATGPSREWKETVEEEERPIWMNYMSEEEKATLESEEEPEAMSSMNFAEEESRPEPEEDDYIDEPIIDLTDEDPVRKEAEDLKEYLSMGRNRFVRDIFGGSAQAYEETIKEIAALSDWRGASKYIQKEVFQRNMVDMYSESAIEFTDRLQSYFSAKEN